ncbi:MAG: hypothetical protein IT373_23995 [Polyangiaceae bacterium]|nr:hypothetical protein [Polyangiaceae bacterium]
MPLAADEVLTRLARELRTLRSVRLGPGLPERLAALLPRALVTRRAGPVDACVVAATQVSTTGAVVPEPPRGLCEGARRTLVVMSDVARGAAPFLTAGAGRLRPLSLYCELAVIDVCADGAVVRELAPGVSARQVQALLDGSATPAATEGDRGPPALLVPANVAEMRVLRDGSRHGLA